MSEDQQIEKHLSRIKQIQSELKEKEKEPITEDFLLHIGFEIRNKYPLSTIFKHRDNDRLFCNIGKYGEFSIVEYHWLNDYEEVRAFKTYNDKLTKGDFFAIINLANIKL